MIREVSHPQSGSAASPMGPAVPDAGDPHPPAAAHLPRTPPGDRLLLPASFVDIAVPVTRLSLAKTRLNLPPKVRSRLVLAFLADTLHAALHCSLVRTVTVVTDDVTVAGAARRAGAQVHSPRLSDPDLNRDLAAFARTRAGEVPLAVLLADLPALTTGELTDALHECASQAGAFATDHQAEGTTLLYSSRADMLQPEFGKLSAHQHHITGVHPLIQVGPGLRRDVDTTADLLAATKMGVGVHTSAALRAYPLLLASRDPTSTGLLMGASRYRHVRPRPPVTRRQRSDDRDRAGISSEKRTPTIADPFADLLDTLSVRQRRAFVVRLTTGYYEGWRPTRSEVADLVAVELGLLPVEESLHRHRQRSLGEQPPDQISRILAMPPLPMTSD